MCGLEKKKIKKKVIFISISPGEGLSNIHVLTFLPVPNEGIFSYLGYEILI